MDLEKEIDELLNYLENRKSECKDLMCLGEDDINRVIDILNKIKG